MIGTEVIVVERPRQVGKAHRDPNKSCGTPSRRTGKPCLMGKGERTDHIGYGNCWLHAGRTGTGKRHAAIEKAQRALDTLGVPLQVDPIRALREAVWECAGNVAFLRERVADMGLDVTRVNIATRPDGATIELGEEVRAMVRLYNEERDRLVKTAKAAVDAGVAEREISLLEDQADRVAKVIFAIFDDLGLDEGQIQQARQLAATRFAALQPA